MIVRMRDLKGILRKSAMGLALTSAAVLAAGCAGHFVANAIEKGISDRLPELIGPAKSYTVDVQGSTRQMMRGRMDQIVIRGKGVRMMPDLILDDLEVWLNDVVADPNTSTLKSVGDVQFDAVITQDALNGYLMHTRPESIRVTCLDQRMIVDAHPKLLRISTNVKLTGRLIPKGQRLNFIIDKLEVAGIGTPSIAADYVEGRINPVLDLGKMSLSPELKSVTVVPGAVRFSGTARIAGLDAQMRAGK